MVPIHLVLRLARRLHEAWAARGDPRPNLEVAWRALDRRLAATTRARDRLRLAESKGLSLVAPRLRARLTSALDDLQREVERLQVAYAPPPTSVLALDDWVREVRQLDAEFGGLAVRWPDAVLRVVTDPIVLRGVALGPFAVDFFWNRVGQVDPVRCFDVVALEPNPADGREDVTHPHVQHAELCPGEAEKPIDRAVADGRLADAFLLVRSVLTTYNSRSPFVPLVEWDAVACGDCGGRVSRDERLLCEGCEDAVCASCLGACEACTASRCEGCLTRCAVCRAPCCPGCLDTRSGRSLCPACLAPCVRCAAAVPKDELPEATRLCSTCEPNEETNDDDETTPRSTADLRVPAG